VFSHSAHWKTDLRTNNEVSLEADNSLGVVRRPIPDAAEHLRIGCVDIEAEDCAVDELDALVRGYHPTQDSLVRRSGQTCSHPCRLRKLIERCTKQDASDGRVEVCRAHDGTDGSQLLVESAREELREPMGEDALDGVEEIVLHDARVRRRCECRLGRSGASDEGRRVWVYGEDSSVVIGTNTGSEETSDTTRMMASIHVLVLKPDHGANLPPQMIAV
jgi:hypothetical protein